jgi:hypothetical protein
MKINALIREEQKNMFTKILKAQITRWMGVILIGALLLVTPAATVSAATPTPTPQTQPAGKATATPAKLAQDYQKEQQALKAQNDNLTKVNTMITKANSFLTTLKSKGKDVDILQTVLNQFTQDLGTATAFHNQATQILTTHSGFDNNGNVIDQAQAVTTLLSARDKMVEARLTLKGGISDLREAIQLFRSNKGSNSQTAPTATPTPVQ